MHLSESDIHTFQNAFLQPKAGPGYAWTAFHVPDVLNWLGLLARIGVRASDRTPMPRNLVQRLQR